MDQLSTADVVLLVIAGYIAVVTLVRLMLRHREQVTAQVREKFKREQIRRRKEEQTQTKAEAREQRKRDRETQDEQAA